MRALSCPFSNRLYFARHLSSSLPLGALRRSPWLLQVCVAAGAIRTISDGRGMLCLEFRSLSEECETFYPAFVWSPGRSRCFVSRSLWRSCRIQRRRRRGCRGSAGPDGFVAVAPSRQFLLRACRRGRYHPTTSPVVGPVRCKPLHCSDTPDRA